MISRRALFCLLPGLAAANETELPSDLKRFRDPATETEILQYTDPRKYSSYLLPAHLRSVSRRNNWMLICSDRAGEMQLFRMELKSGDLRQITSFPGGVRIGAAALLPDEKAVCCLHGDTVEFVPLGSGRTRTLHESGGGWTSEALAVSDDGQTCFVLERSGERTLVRALGISRRTNEAILDERGEVGGLRPRPRAQHLLYKRDGRLWLLAFGKERPRELPTPARVRQAFWTGDGKTLVYITDPETDAPVELREHAPDGGEDKLIARTSQFASFARNTDASVFVGASGSKVSPFLLLLLRVSRRELTLSEHRASLAAAVVVFFTPDSQRIFYHTDKQGRPAIYGIPAEQLVEKTEI